MFAELLYNKRITPTLIDKCLKKCEKNILEKKDQDLQVQKLTGSFKAIKPGSGSSTGSKNVAKFSDG